MNHLANSLSPYLLQHRNNPVEWYPWGDQAFAKASQTDRPIFLSIGYAACHWCHVMEHESFENREIAAFLNARFISIKVDREERPDIDQIYMNSVQLMSGRGGWPMSVFLNHEKKPFYAGTYWPPTERFGMPGFREVLQAIADACQHRRQEVDHHADKITASLQQLARGTPSRSQTLPDASVVENASDRLLRQLDVHHGGFGPAPKFPHVTDLELLLRQAVVRGRSDYADAAQFTLDRMAAGGIRDHIGGGFSRYSVDKIWLVPHFEKMLYDNALLAKVYIRAFQVTGHRRHAEEACGILDYLDREMSDPSGGFHCSEDADSEGVEGKYYVWTPAEVKSILGSERGELFCEVYDITEAGNFEGHSIANLLNRSIEDVSRERQIPNLAEQLAVDREKLRVVRDGRVHPGRDDKILTAWNSLAVTAFAIAGGVLDRPDYLAISQRAMQFTLEQMMDNRGRLRHAYRQGHAHLDGYLDDYAFSIEALISLFEATGLTRYIRSAVKLADIMVDRFLDRDAGGFFYTADDSETLITRTKDWYDGSLISGNASAVNALLHLSQLCNRSDYRQAAEQTLRCASEIISTEYPACPSLVCALDRCLHDSEQLVLAVPDLDSLARMRATFLRSYRPRTTLSWAVSQSPSDRFVVALNEHRSVVDQSPTLYRCQQMTCELPIIGDDVSQWLAR